MTPDTIDAMLAAGLTREQMAELIKHELAKMTQAKAEKRAKDAARQRKSRMSRNVTVTACDTLPPPDGPLSLPQTPTQSPLNPPTSPAPRDAARLPYDEIEAKCRKAAGLESDPSPGLMDLSPIVSLIDAGADLERQIIPVIRSKTRRGVRSWRFFLPAIEEALAAKPLIIAKPTTSDEGERYRAMAQSWERGNWSDFWGPEPGQPGCRLPVEFIPTQPRTGKERDAA